MLTILTLFRTHGAFTMNPEAFKVSLGNILQIIAIVTSVTAAYSALKADISVINTKLLYIDRDIATIQRAFGILDKQP